MKALPFFVVSAVCVYRVGCDACSETGPFNGTCAQIDSGTLEVIVSAPDVGVAPAITVAGPGLNEVISVSADLTVPPGIYSVVPSVLISPDPVAGVGYWATVTGSPATVTSSGVSKVIVNFPSSPSVGSGMLWVPANTGSIFGYSASSLRTDGGTLVPAVTLFVDAGTDGGPMFQAVAFAPNGDLWAAEDSKSGSTTTLPRLWHWQLLADGGSMVPVVINVVDDVGRALDAKSLVFAPNGDLWVIDHQDNAVLRYTTAQLSAGGPQVPATVISSTSIGGCKALSSPYSGAFDRDGNLWVGNIVINGGTGTSVLTEYPNTGDGGIGTLPSLAIYDDAGIAINGLAFDPQGHLWLASYEDSSVVRAHITGLTQVSQLSAEAILTGPDIAGPDSITFDQSGNMWIINQSTGTIAMIADPGSLQGPVRVSAVVFDAGLVEDNGRFQFNPPTPGLGLFPN